MQVFDVASKIVLVASMTVLPSACASPASGSTDANGQMARNAPYPREAFRLGQEGEVRLSMCVGLDGRTRELKIVKSSGSASLDQASLELFSRARMTPGTDSSGNPVDRCDPPYETTVSWRLPR